MRTNEEIIKIHDALVDKAAVKCAVEGSSKTAVEIGNEIIAYGKLWLDAFANDGRIDDAETAVIKDGFHALVGTRVKDVEFSKLSPVTWAYFAFIKGRIENKLGIEY